MIVWLASYPRSGNTFLRVILNSVFDLSTYSIYGDRHDIGASKETKDIVGHKYLEKDFTIEKARIDENTYIIKTHELLDERISNEDKVVYLIRDGRDCVLSFTKHQNIYSNLNKKIIDTIYGNTFVGSWGEHVASWGPKNRKNTLLIKFEDLVSWPTDFIGTISEFINVLPISDKIPSFNELKSVDNKFFRSGKTNAWESEFTSHEHIAYWLQNYNQMMDYEYSYNMPNEIKNCNDLALFVSISNQNAYLIKLTNEGVQYNKDNYNKDNLRINNELLRIKNELLEKERIIEARNKAIEKQGMYISNLTESGRYKFINSILYPLDFVRSLTRK